MSDIRSKVHENFDEMISWRRDFLRHPELSNEEFRTSDKIAELLKSFGCDSVERPRPTGVVALIKGEKPGGCVAIRADIDALPVTENTGLAFSSENEGVMHACGHDTHAAMLLCAAKVLCGMRSELPGTVKLIFQPAEETGQAARLMIEQGALEGVSMTFGLHLLACFKPGWLSAATGASAPAASRFSINIKGKTTHGARPEAGVDATVAASALVMNLQTIVSREMSPKQQVVVTVGQLHSGTRFNIVSGEAFLDGTVRCYDRDIHHAMPGIFERIVQGTAAAYRCEAELSYDKMVEVLINDERGSQFVYEAAKKVVEEPSFPVPGS